MTDRFVKEHEVREEPRTVREKTEVEVPRTVMEKKTIEVPRTVMEKETVEDERVVSEAVSYDKLVAASCGVVGGSDIYNPQGDKLGKIDDLMIDLQKKTIAYAIMKTDSFLGLGGKLLPIPMEALSVESTTDSDEPRFVLNVPKEAIDDAEGYDADNLPKKVDYNWLSGIYSHYGFAPYWKEHKEMTSEEKDVHTDLY